jgi:acyl carrier protein
MWYSARVGKSANAVIGSPLPFEPKSIAPSTMPATQTPAEHELAQLIVQAVNLEGVSPDDIDPQAPLFGSGLGLDSIDALEIALEISKRYGFQLRSDDEENRRIFASLRALSEHIERNRRG